MKKKLREIRETLSRSIFVGDRCEKNLRNIVVMAVIVMALGGVLTVLNLAQKQYVMALTCFMLLLSELVSYIAVKRYKNKNVAMAITLLVVVFVLTYDVLFADNGFAFLWTLLVPLAISYMFSIRIGAAITGYFQLLFVILFYTPIRQYMAPRYSEIMMARFPLLFFFYSLVVMFIMYQYHRSVLFEIDYTDKLNEEVARQTAVAEERSHRIEQMSLQTIQTLANAIDAKDPYTKGHSTRVSQYSVLIAEALGWDRERLNNLRYSALLHDIGKIGVPDSILNNPKRLTEVEYDIIKSHTTMGGDILRDRIIIGIAEGVARSHHERYDGKGYPQGLKGEEISEEARIVAIADAFDSMSSNRVYRKACDRAYIRRELSEGRGKQFDPRFVDIFLALWDSGKVDAIIRSEYVERDTGVEASSALLQEVMEAFVSQSTVDDTDIVTGVMSRTAGEAAIARVMKEDSGCFVFFDVDNLKKINDTNGHKAGDKALKLMGDTLLRHSEDGLCCRLGGDEFLLFLRNATKDQAESRVREIIRDYDERKQESVEITSASLSAGMVMCTPADPYAKVYSMADKALYYVKQNGKNGCSFYHGETETEGGDQVDMSRLLHGIRSSGSYDGAMDVEYRQFAKLYDFIENLEKRFAQPFKLIMITLDTASGEASSLEELEKAMYYMEQSIRLTIRNVDVITRYSRCQFLVILLGADAEGVRIAVSRIFRGYYKMNGSGAFSPSYAVADPQEEDGAADAQP